MERSQFDLDSSPGEVRGDEGYNAYYPDPLPPDLELDPELISTLSDADRAIGELAGIGRTVENPHMLIRPFIRQEAVMSSRIEGTYADLSEVYAAEAEASQGDRLEERNDAREVLNYARAVEFGLAEITEHDRAIDITLMKEMHGMLLGSGGVRGESKFPGELKTKQNFLGSPSSSVQSARFVPPPPQQAQYALQELEAFLLEGSQYPDLIDIGLSHYQFEVIHPFMDGNGRIGRLLITLLLCERELLPEPFLYISAFFEKHRREYFDRLYEVSTRGAWEPWLEFFLTGITEQSIEAVIRSKELLRLKEEYTDRYVDSKSKTLLNLVYHLFSNPVITVPQVKEALGVTYPTANRAVDRLETDGVLLEMTGNQRNRRFVAEDIYDIIRLPVDEIATTEASRQRQAQLEEF